MNSFCIWKHKIKRKRMEEKIKNEKVRAGNDKMMKINK